MPAESVDPVVRFNELVRCMAREALEAGFSAADIVDVTKRIVSDENAVRMAAATERMYGPSTDFVKLMLGDDAS